MKVVRVGHSKLKLHVHMYMYDHLSEDKVKDLLFEFIIHTTCGCTFSIHLMHLRVYNQHDAKYYSVYVGLTNYICSLQ